jgi:hypothetical protein
MHVYSVRNLQLNYFSFRYSQPKKVKKERREPKKERREPKKERREP